MNYEKQLKENGYPFEDMSLDKLKEACGKSMLSRITHTKDGKYIAAPCFMGIMTHKKDTPEEAIADLWIVMKKYIEDNPLTYSQYKSFDDFKFNKDIALRYY